MRTNKPSGRNPVPYARARACRAAFALLACLLTGLVQAAPRLLVTIDVESVEGAPLPDQIDAHCRDGSACGLMEIARLLEAHSLRGSFFLNVYESHKWGEPTLRRIAEQLTQRGHEVALHTHPHWYYDPKRPYMYQYSAEEQVRIVREGAALLQAWTGAPVIAHRAGAYSADPRTLDALRANGIALDSSWFRDDPHSKLGSLGLPENAAGTARGVLEIPVTVYERVETPHGLSFLPGVNTTRKLDANWFRDTDEAARTVDATIAADPPYMLFFLHSFSLLIPDGTATPAADANARANFRVMLERAAAHGLVGETFREIHDGGGAPIATAAIRVPMVELGVPLPNYAVHLIKMRPLLVAMLALAALALAWSIWRAWRRPRRVRALVH
jgi:peptidoglycan/xylan/chitin deacetylase (PgdA/CDA1 family)